MSAEFIFVFVAMGQGDCCMVKCPDGRIVVVDCGSIANPWGDQSYVTEAQIQLRTWAASQGNKIAALVLTHPDADHHNKVVDFFRKIEYADDVTLPSSGQVLTRPTIGHCDIEKIYFSDAYSDESPLGNYKGAALNLNVYAEYFKTSEIHEVTINDANDENNFYKTWKKDSNFKKPTTTKIEKKLLSVVSGENWSVSVIAGNVPIGYGGEKDSATSDNAMSLITLFEVDDKKALLTGDATFSTEKFLQQNHQALLANLELVQVPHHGSAYASSDMFTAMVKPKAAVVSVGFLEHSFRLPRYENVLERWLEVVENRKATLADHNIDYWTDDNCVDMEITDRTITHQIIDEKLAEWTNEKKNLGWNVSKAFCWLWSPGKGVYGLYKLQQSGNFLFRETVNSNLCLTSQKTQVYRLSEAGVTYAPEPMPMSDDKTSESMSDDKTSESMSDDETSESMSDVED